jgi:Caspase domain
VKKNLLLVALLLSGRLLQGQQRFSVYYLVIGSAAYEHDSKKFKERNFIPFDDLPEAATSANIISGALQVFGDAKGLTLIGTTERVITKARITSGLETVIGMVRRDHPKNPLVIVYFCGHGISENLGWSQYLIPGNYTYVAGNKSIDHLTAHLVSLGDLADRLDKTKQRFMVIVDCCRKEEKDNSLPEARLRYFFSDQNVETFKITLQVVKYLNEFHQSNPVVFSIAPGLLAPTAPMPMDPVLTKALNINVGGDIGPVCRRLMLCFSKWLQTGRNEVGLTQLVGGLTDNGLDRKSPTSVSFYTDSTDRDRDIPLLHLNIRKATVQ